MFYSTSNSTWHQNDFNAFPRYALHSQNLLNTPLDLGSMVSFTHNKNMRATLIKRN